MSSHSNISVADSFSTLKKSRLSRKLLPLSTRLEKLDLLYAAIDEHEESFFSALKLDLGRSRFESYVTEIAMVKSEIRLAQKSLPAWMKPKRVSTPLAFQPGRSFIEASPKGLVLIISPWNYPIQLSLLPLVSAIAAGNCAIIKPSEHAPASAKLLCQIVNECLDASCFRAISGDAKIANELLSLHFDHIFYTGGERIAREVLKMAVQNLTPTTLELGGKSPCLIDSPCDLELAVKRIWWAKCLNAGQTCVAPDYVLIKNELFDDFIKLSKKYLSQSYGADIDKNDSYGRIINEQHASRLVNYLAQGKIAIGGAHDIKQRFIEPTLLTDIDIHAPVMEEEIFGPILPLIKMRDLEEGIDFVENRPRPLALYFFGTNKNSIQRIRNHTQSGGLSINDCVSQAGILGLPFGGIGSSGMGSYHGKFGFETFSHFRAVHQRANILDNPIKYPPYSDQKLKLARMVL
jgi:aldehyde dehydrogenase (NAD+)